MYLQGLKLVTKRHTPMCCPLRGFLVLGLLLYVNLLTIFAEVPNDTESLNFLLPAGQNAYLDDAVVLLSDRTFSNHILSINASSASSGPPSLNSSSSGSLFVDKPKYICNGATYGRNLNIRSCLDTLESIQEYHLPQTFGERGSGTKWDINLPFRFLSSKCK